MSKAKATKSKTDNTQDILTVTHRAEVESMKTKSEKIRFLTSQGYTTSEIARALGIIYQHAYNVQKQVLGKMNSK